jgi:hypothetical protein
MSAALITIHLQQNLKMTISEGGGEIIVTFGNKCIAFQAKHAYKINRN